MSIIVIKAAGEALPKATKAAAEVLHYTIDCRGLLEPNELVIKGQPVNLSDALDISDIRTWGGNGLVFKLASTSLDTSAYQDHLVALEYETTLNNKRIAQFSLRVYK